IVTLQTKTAGTAIDLGSNTAGTLGLTEGELDRVKAGTLRIGRNDASASGTITLSAPVDLTTASTVGGFTVPTLQLFTGADVVDGTAGEQTDLTVATLSITAGGSIGSAGVGDINFQANNLTTDTSAGSGSQFLNASGTTQLGTANALNAGMGTITLTGGTFQIQASAGGNAIADTSQLTVNSPALLDLNGQTERFDGLNGNGTATAGVAATTSTLTVGVSGGSGTFSGVLQVGNGTLALTKRGAGTETLSGTMNTYTGATTVNGGTLLVNGSTDPGS